MVSFVRDVSISDENDGCNEGVGGVFTKLLD